MHSSPPTSPTPAELNQTLSLVSSLAIKTKQPWQNPPVHRLVPLSLLSQRTEQVSCGTEEVGGAATFGGRGHVERWRS